MKFYSYSNKNGNYSKAVSLKNVRSVNWYEGSGSSKVRYGVRLDYENGTNENLNALYDDEAKNVFNEIVKILNKG